MKSLYSLGKELASQTDSFTKVLHRENHTVTCFVFNTIFHSRGKKQSGERQKCTNIDDMNLIQQ